VPERGIGTHSPVRPGIDVPFLKRIFSNQSQFQSSFRTMGGIQKEVVYDTLFELSKISIILFTRAGREGSLAPITRTQSPGLTLFANLASN